ncbi:peptidase inhibitor family I36 protein [Streptomyces sp. CBMA156]|uniref:peptidase inhibitor family I36 protein n=1 Tax=Streptomyces sp. CBMA156 TaxID=1930280 RepID=UPI0016619A03|nr:peptidase inhibitor family I36 protein [Streptomyces sp. CBMA156]
MPAAQASTGPIAEGSSVAAFSDCPAGWFCVWTGTNGTGTMARFQSGAADLSDLGMNNNISSLWNRTSSTWCVFMDKNYGGSHAAVAASDSGNLNSTWDNKISSLKKGACPS